MSRPKASTRDPEGFAIPEKLRSVSTTMVDSGSKENWPISEKNATKRKFSKTQLQTRCRLFKTIRSALDNPGQSKTLTNSVFNQIRRGLFEPPSHSSFVSSLREISRLILEGGGIPSVFLQSVPSWDEPDSSEACLQNLILDIKQSNVSILQYYPIKPKRSSERPFSELFSDFFAGIGENLSKNLPRDPELEALTFLCSWLKSISKVQIRPLRHSASVAMNGIFKGLVAARADILEKLSRFNIQLEEEFPESGTHETLEEECQRTYKLSNVLERILTDIILDFWIPRVQDVSPEIRLSCLANFSNSILQPHMARIICDAEVPELLMELLPEESTYNRTRILHSLLNCTGVEFIRSRTLVLFCKKSFLRALRNAVALAVKVPHDLEISNCGELALRILQELLRYGLLDEEFVDEVVDLLWLGPPPGIGSILAEFIDIALFEGGISHENVETRELVELASSRIESKRIRSLIGLDTLQPLEPSRIRSDLQTFLEFIREFGKDLVVLTHRCVNAFWEKAPCVRDSKFLVEMLLATECSSSGSQLEPLDEEVRKTLLLVLHANVSHIEGLILAVTEDSPTTYFNKAEIFLCRPRAFVAISAVLEYMEPLILIHEKNTDQLAILLSIFSICTSLYCKLMQERDNSGFIPSGLKSFPLGRLLKIFHSHSDSRVIDGVCMTLAPVVSFDTNNAILKDNSFQEIQKEVAALNTKLFDSFLKSGREFLSNTDGILYSKVSEIQTEFRKMGKLSDIPNANLSPLNLFCNIRRAFGALKYLTTENVFISNRLKDASSPNRSSEMSPEQSSGVPVSFEVLFEVIERAERILQLELSETLTYQSTQLFSVTLDMVTTGYAHLVQDLLQGLDIDSPEEVSSRRKVNENQLLTLKDLKESTIEVFKVVRHKLSTILLESLRSNMKHHPRSNQSLNLVSLLSLCSLLVMSGLQGTIENNLQDPEADALVNWPLSNSDLVLITKELIYWTSPRNSRNLQNETKTFKLSSPLIEAFGSLLSFSEKDKPFHILYPSCRVFEPLDNLKDEAFVTNPYTLNAYKTKIQNFLEHKFSPGCVLSLIAISSKYKLTTQIFTPVIFNYLADIENVMVEDYYIESIYYSQGKEASSDKLPFLSKFLEMFFMGNQGWSSFGAFSCILVSLILSHIQDNSKRTRILSKKLFPAFSSRVGWKKTEEFIKTNSSDLNRSILESFRFSLFGQLSIGIFRDTISRDELIANNTKTKEVIGPFLDFLTTQNAPGGKTILSLLSSQEIEQILEEAKKICGIDGENSSNGLPTLLNSELFDIDVMNFLDIISGKHQKKTVVKSKNPQKSGKYFDLGDNPISLNPNIPILESPITRNEPKKKRSKTSNSESEWSDEDENDNDETLEDSKSSEDELDEIEN
ncbi:nuclear protein SA-1 related protein [Cryptosporidium felis]|nr:nuclear protein SA-1 related protein [Cryptosporidium felis]